MLRDRLDKNQSIRQLPEKLEYWTHDPLFSFLPEREASSYISSVCCTSDSLEQKEDAQLDFFFFPVASRHLEYTGSCYCSEAEFNSLISHPGSWNIRHLLHSSLLLVRWRLLSCIGLCLLYHVSSGAAECHPVPFVSSCPWASRLCQVPSVLWDRI